MSIGERVIPCKDCGFGSAAHKHPFTSANCAYTPAVVCTNCECYIFKWSRPHDKDNQFCQELGRTKGVK